jgi:hypothetical protein
MYGLGKVKVFECDVIFQQFDREMWDFKRIVKN